MDKENKEDFMYFNEEWNSWEDIPEDKTNIKRFISQSIEESPILKLIKNNKPDGRRYKK